MGDEIYVNGSIIRNTQIGGKNNKMIVVDSKESEWAIIEEIWNNALEITNDNKTKSLVVEALEITKQKDKCKLSGLVKKFFGEFTKEVLTGAAAEIVLRFLNII